MRKKKKGRQNSACFQPNLGNFHNNFHLKLKLHKAKLKIVGWWKNVFIKALLLFFTKHKTQVSYIPWKRNKSIFVGVQNSSNVEALRVLVLWSYTWNLFLCDNFSIKGVLQKQAKISNKTAVLTWSLLIFCLIIYLLIYLSVSISLSICELLLFCPKSWDGSLSQYPLA